MEETIRSGVFSADQKNQMFNMLHDVTRRAQFPSILPDFIRATPFTTERLAGPGQLRPPRQLWLRRRENARGQWFEVVNDDDETEEFEFFVASDQIPSNSYFTSQGIIGLYLTIVLTGSRFLRMFLTGLTFKIPYEDLPSVDRLLDMCKNIVMVREFDEFEIEEVLYWQLVTIFRSSDMMIIMSRFERPAAIQNVTSSDQASPPRSEPAATS